MRPTRENLIFSILELIQLRSTCNRLHVACAFVKKGRIICTGYNGPPKDEEHCDEMQCNLKEPCQFSKHAEDNAIEFAHGQGISLKGSTLFVTHSPCRGCSEKLVKAGIKKVLYKTLFRDDTGLKYLLNKGVEVIHYTHGE